MLVYLVRHGDAVPAEVDPARPLSAKGRAEVEATAKELLSERVQISEIWHSSKLRAKQTAEILARVLGVNKVSEKKGLNPDDPATPIAELLRQASSGSPSTSLGASEARFVERNALRVTDNALPNAHRNRITHNAHHSILLVGHLPFLPKLANLLDPKLGIKELRTGEAIRISI